MAKRKLQSPYDGGNSMEVWEVDVLGDSSETRPVDILNEALSCLTPLMGRLGVTFEMFLAIFATYSAGHSQRIEEYLQLVGFDSVSLRLLGQETGFHLNKIVADLMTIVPRNFSLEAIVMELRGDLSEGKQKLSIDKFLRFLADSQKSRRAVDEIREGAAAQTESHARISEPSPFPPPSYTMLPRVIAGDIHGGRRPVSRPLVTRGMDKKPDDVRHEMSRRLRRRFTPLIDPAEEERKRQLLELKVEKSREKMKSAPERAEQARGVGFRDVYYPDGVDVLALQDLKRNLLGALQKPLSDGGSFMDRLQDLNSKWGQLTEDEKGAMFREIKDLGTVLDAKIPVNSIILGDLRNLSKVVLEIILPFVGDSNGLSVVVDLEYDVSLTDRQNAHFMAVWFIP